MQRRKYDRLKQLESRTKTGIAGESHDNRIETGYITRKYRGMLGRQLLSWHGRQNPVHHSQEVAQGTRCGHRQHSHAECPVRDATCHKCEKRRHFSSQCISKQNLSELKQGASVWTCSGLPTYSDTVDIDSGFLDTVSETSGQTAWVVPVFVGANVQTE